MTKHLLLAALAPLALATGCAGTENRGLESVHQPVVTRTDYVFDVAAGPSGLAPAERRRLAGWLAGLRLGYGDRIAVDDPTALGNEAVRRDVAAAVERHGLLLSNDAPITGAPVAPGMVRVVVSRTAAFVPGCPDWSRMSVGEVNSNTSSDFGCTINTNMAMMVANPADLVRGQADSSTTDPALNSRAIGAFRGATPSGAGGSKVGN